MTVLTEGHFSHSCVGLLYNGSGDSSKHFQRYQKNISSCLHGEDKALLVSSCTEC